MNDSDLIKVMSDPEISLQEKEKFLTETKNTIRETTATITQKETEEKELITIKKAIKELVGEHPSYIINIENVTFINGVRIENKNRERSTTSLSKQVLNLAVKNNIEHRDNWNTNEANEYPRGWLKLAIEEVLKNELTK